MALTICSRCLKGVPADSPRCRHCGEPTATFGTVPLAPVAKRLLCQRCFKPVTSYDSRCESCGGDPAPKPAMAQPPTGSTAQGIAVLSVLAASAAVFLWPDSPDEKARKARERRGYAARTAAVTMLQNSVKDPRSMETRSLKAVEKDGRWVVCGQVNARNSFGAYTGFQRFAVSSGGLVVVEEQDAGTLFADLQENCSRWPVLP